jgi:uncharacterized protein YodC (DUF2158 family)
MSAEQLKLGDKVQLKSGGPVMTVAEIDSAGEALCKWQEGRQPMQGSFPQDQLVKVPAS